MKKFRSKMGEKIEIEILKNPKREKKNSI